MKIAFFLLFTFLSVTCFAQEESFQQQVEEYVKEYNSILSTSKTAINFKGISISDPENDKTFYFVNAKYYVIKQNDRKTLGVYKTVTRNSIPIAILFDDDRILAFVVAKNSKEYLVKYDSRTEQEIYFMSGRPHNEFEYILDGEQISSEVNYADPQVILYVKNGKLGIKFNGKNILQNECDSLDIYGKMAVVFDTKKSLYRTDGRLLLDSIKTFYKYSLKYYQVIDAQNAMYFVDTLGMTYKMPVEKRYLMGNDTDPNRTVVYYLNGKNVIRSVRIYQYDRIDYSDDLNIDKIELPRQFKYPVFINNKSKILAEDYWYYVAFYQPLPPNYVVVKSNSKFGVWDLEERKTIIPFVYSKIIPKNSHLFLYKKQLKTCYPYIGLSPKYKVLEDYIEYYARFAYPNGKKGWVDRKGVEYFD